MTKILGWVNGFYYSCYAASTYHCTVLFLLWNNWSNSGTTLIWFTYVSENVCSKILARINIMWNGDTFLFTTVWLSIDISLIPVHHCVFAARILLSKRVQHNQFYLDKHCKRLGDQHKRSQSSQAVQQARCPCALAKGASVQPAAIFSSLEFCQIKSSLIPDCSLVTMQRLWGTE